MVAAEQIMNWNRVVFLHTGWTSRYDGTEAPEGGHAYLKRSVGVEAENFKSIDGWCYGYAPVSRTSKGRAEANTSKAGRTLNISKLGASALAEETAGITIVWTARHPARGPVIVGLYDNAIVFRFMPGLSGGTRPFIAKARDADCHLVPEKRRSFDIIQKREGFPGMAAAWFPGLHADGPAKEMLANVADYLPMVRHYSRFGTTS